MLLLQATLCYYDVRDALSLDPYQPQALKLMEEIEATAKTNREQAVGLTLQVCTFLRVQIFKKRLKRVDVFLRKKFLTQFQSIVALTIGSKDS